MNTKTLHQLVDEWREAEAEWDERVGAVGGAAAARVDDPGIVAAFDRLGVAAITLARRVSACTDSLLIDAADALLRDLRDTRRRPLEDYRDLSIDLTPRAATFAAVVLDAEGRSYVHMRPAFHGPPSLERHALAGAVAGLANMLTDSIERHALEVDPS